MSIFCLVMDLPVGDISGLAANSSGTGRRMGFFVGVRREAEWALCPGCAPGFFPVGLRLFGTFFRKGRAEEGREEFSKFVFNLFSSFRFDPLSIRTSALAFSARVRRRSFSLVRSDTCSLSSRFSISMSRQRLSVSLQCSRSDSCYRSLILMTCSRWRM